MNLLVCEFITGGGLLGEPLPECLAAEGELMLQSLLRDLRVCPDVRVSCTRDNRLPTLPGPVETLTLAADEDLFRWLQQSLGQFDAVCLIAPETDGVLYRLVSLIEQFDVLHLGSTARAIQVCTDKRETAKRLAEAGIHVVPAIEEVEQTVDCDQAWVIKPVDGAGSENTVYCESRQKVLALINTASARPHLIQPFLEGQVASMSLFCVGSRVYLLAINEMLIEIQNDMIKVGAICVNGLWKYSQECLELAEQVVRCLPGLQAYVGIDLVFTDDGPVILEINPRLTSSCVGLAESCGINLAALMLAPESAEHLLPDHDARREPVLIHL